MKLPSTVIENSPALPKSTPGRSAFLVHIGRAPRYCLLLPSIGHRLSRAANGQTQHSSPQTNSRTLPGRRVGGTRPSITGNSWENAPASPRCKPAWGRMLRLKPCLTARPPATRTWRLSLRVQTAVPGNYPKVRCCNPSWTTPRHSREQRRTRTPTAPGRLPASPRSGMPGTPTPRKSLPDRAIIRHLLRARHSQLSTTYRLARAC